MNYLKILFVLAALLGGNDTAALAALDAEPAPDTTIPPALDALAEPSSTPTSVRPVAPIYANGLVIGLTANDPGVEFMLPDHWALKPGGAVLRLLPDESYELRLLLEPSYEQARKQSRSAAQRDPFKVYLPAPVTLIKAELYVDSIMGDLKAAFVPYPGNSTPGFYFRIALDKDQLTTLQRLSVQHLTFTGDVSYAIEAGELNTTSTVPIAIDVPASVLQTSSQPGPAWQRVAQTDSGFGGGVASNGTCDGAEWCAFRSNQSRKVWVAMRSGAKLSPAQWAMTCERLRLKGSQPMRLPTAGEVAAAVRAGLWTELRQAMFSNAAAWGTPTSTKADAQGKVWWLSVSADRRWAIPAGQSMGDRALCVDE